ncbi:DUF4828 domain-containing protein [Enterococcus rivorum]|uniref:DUF4828 domain-containing protein n=1 Tax=Enterococcus rivorum TaxID=762845 RepID=A0A1E5KVB4_9ENTE|nr:DUF4828 domain-containing protein [Enterococcus rivorum]MBP2098376.1 LPXTG-motif cell wall-anchored protein [Enterococcus rivorum]OEH81837.1 DUF4828 domain-containing protein [Enterococcus rivorum]
MKKHWSFLLGASLLTGFAGSFFLKKKREIEQTELPANNLYKIYSGSWWFVNKLKATQHTLEIDDKLTITIDGKELQYLLIELNSQRLVAQDEFGYHLIVQCNRNSTPTSLYDEADDCTYLLEPVLSVDELAK